MAESRSIAVTVSALEAEVPNLSPTMTGGHGMAIDQHGKTEGRMSAHHQLLQGFVERLVDGFDPHHRLGQRQAAGIDVKAVADQLRHGAKAARHAGRANVAIGRHRLRKHARIEFPGFPVGVEIGARKIGRQQGSAKHDAAAEQLVDIAVLGAAHIVLVEPAHRQKALRVMAPAVRRAENERHPLLGGRSHLEGGNNRKILGRACQCR
jgi:hypothetical protein